jgi:WD40 repeat protein
VDTLSLSQDGFTLAALSSKAKGDQAGLVQPLFLDLVGDRRREFKTEEIEEQRYEGVAISPFCDTVALAGRGIILYDLNSLEPIGNPLEDSQCARLAFVGRSRLIAGSYIDGEVKEWDLSKGTCARRRRPQKKVVALTASPDGAWAASAGRDEDFICFWKPGEKGGEQKLNGEWEKTTFLTILHDNDTLLSMHKVDKEAVLRIWSLKEARQVKEWKPESGELCAVAASPDGRHIATAIATYRADHLIQVWDGPAFLAE